MLIGYQQLEFTISDAGSGTTTKEAVKQPVIVATTAAITLNGEQTIDSVAIVNGDRVLINVIRN